MNTERVFKPLPLLDAEIRTIQLPDKENEYYIVSCGLFSSLGEQGEIVTYLYNNRPEEWEIIMDIKQHLKDLKVDYDGNICLTAREEKYYEILNKVKNEIY